MHDRAPAALPFGSWPSPLRARDLADAAMSISYVTACGGRLYWVEARPAERGRNVLMSAAPDGDAREESPAPIDVRTRVHEYGGRPYVVAGGIAVHSRFADQRLYAGTSAQPFTDEGLRYADGAAAPDGHTIYLVREDHRGEGDPANTIVAIDLRQPSSRQVLFDRSDFVAYPRPSADGRLAFVSWNHPDMPWDATTLQVGRLVDGRLADLQVVAGGATRESVIEPQWDADGTLYFLSDRSGYWNLYCWRGHAVEQVTALDMDLGGPLWLLGASTYGLTGDGRALLRVCDRATDRLARLDLASGRLSWLALPFEAFGSVGVLDCGTAFAVAAAEDAPAALITIDLDTGAWQTLRSAGPRVLAPEYVSRGEAIEFPTEPGPNGAARSAHAFFHPPHHPGARGPAGARPPLIVLLHGGPTAHASRALSLSIQYWTTRGFAVVNVNYGGSSGFGRAYRERLRGQWGVVDLHDAVAAVDYLVATGRVDGARVAIRGGSAGGYTVLSALAFTQRFAAGINYFGVADLEALAADTHKLESRYLDSLVAPLPEARAIYQARSPIHHLDSLDAALITFQGDEDRAVPPEQSRRIVEAVRARGKPVAYIEFKGEQHGFRDARNIARALEAELYFLGRVFGFAPADAIEPVPIDNLAVVGSAT